MTGYTPAAILAMLYDKLKDRFAQSLHRLPAHLVPMGKVGGLDYHAPYIQLPNDGSDGLEMSIMTVQGFCTFEPNGFKERGLVFALGTVQTNTSSVVTQNALLANVLQRDVTAEEYSKVLTPEYLTAHLWPPLDVTPQPWQLVSFAEQKPANSQCLSLRTTEETSTGRISAYPGFPHRIAGRNGCWYHEDAVKEALKLFNKRFWKT